MKRRIVVDANVAFRSLVGWRGDLRRILLGQSAATFFAPKYLLVELFKHKDRLQRACGLPEEKLLEHLNTLVSCIRFVDEASVPVGTWLEAHRLCKDIDPKDTPYVALALHLDASLWTQDIELKTRLSALGFTNFAQFE